jgi:hypothetical protein
VKSIVSAVSKKNGLIVVGALIEVVTKLVVDRIEVLGGDVDAHLDAQIIDIIDIPGARMTNDVTILGLYK